METLRETGVHIMGSRTFRDMATYWPTSTEPFAAPMNQLPKVVFSTRGMPGTGPTSESWANARVASGELGDEIARLRRETSKEIVAHGGARFAQSLIERALVDEYRLLVHPIALGRGLPLFSKVAEPRDLILVEAKRFAGGAVAHVYQPARR